MKRRIIILERITVLRADKDKAFGEDIFYAGKRQIVIKVYFKNYVLLLYKINLRGPTGALSTVLKEIKRKVH